MYKKSERGGCSINKRLTLMQISNMYAYYYLHTELFLEEGKEVYRKVGGYDRIASLLEEVNNARDWPVITLDNGNTFYGTYPVVQSQGEDLLPLLNQLPIDAMTGHLDYRYGPKHLENLVQSLPYPLLACNCYLVETDEWMFPSHKIIEKQGLKIGVIGAVQHNLKEQISQTPLEGIYFTDAYEEIRSIVYTLQTMDQVDIIILLSHLGLPIDVKIAEDISGINVIVSSHTYYASAEPYEINDTIIMQAGSHGTYLGKLDINIENKQVSSYDYELIEVEETIPPKKEITNLVEQIEAPYKSMLEEVVGWTNTSLHRYGQIETTMDNLLLEALIEETGYDIALTQGNIYGAPIIKGPITRRDLYNIVPENPYVSCLELKGYELKQLLEQNIEYVFTEDVFKQVKTYLLRMYGLKLYVKLENPAGMKIVHLYINDEEVKMDDTYQLVYIADETVPSNFGSNRKHLHVKALDLLIRYIQRKEVIHPSLYQPIYLI